MNNFNKSKNNFFNSKKVNNGMKSLNVSKSNSKTVNNMGKNINWNNIITMILVIILIGLIIYTVVFTVKYYQAICYEKKPYAEYLVDFSDSNVCSVEEKPKPVMPPQEPVKMKPVSKSKIEVFHIANQDYTYDQAKCKCESYGSRLATKDEVTDAYNKGGHWCTYGWSEGQQAFYPVQKCEWDKQSQELERVSEEEKERLRKHSFCGRPGVNGGYFANPLLKFGVNCYGKKPKGSVVKENPPQCAEQGFCKLDVNYNASHKLDTDEIVGFNSSQWNA